MNTNKNLICNILSKDAKGNYRKIFSVEGDKQADASVYFYEWSSGSNDSNKNHYSYHSKKDRNGLVRTHLSGMKDISKRQQKPLEQRDRVICSYHYQSGRDLESFPIGIPTQPDICLTILPIHFGNCEYVFYTTEKGLKEYTNSKSMIVVHKYPMPVKHVKHLNFAVLIQQAVLEYIQSNT
jgi:hypothetical protein